ncbi:MAG TPA: mannose-6-phosphate isomerase, partial [Clostridia bacterium]|nr:mannose-6-phosphate isomerase [Clostridia bacterium]
DSVRMINLVEGEKAFITSPSRQFAAQEIHFAETFVLPAAAGECALTAPEGKTVMFVAASVRA